MCSGNVNAALEQTCRRESLSLLQVCSRAAFTLPQFETIDHFTVVCSVTWPLDGSEAGVDLVLIQTSLLLLCKTSCSDAN